MIIQVHPTINIENSLLNKAAQAVGATAWPQPWDQDEFVSENLSALSHWAKSDCQNMAAIAKAEEEAIAKAEDEEAMEAKIASITDGLDRETVMALAKKALVNARGYWPSIESDSLVVRNTSDQMIVWKRGAETWSRVVSTQGSKDQGAGYGMNQ